MPGPPKKAQLTPKVKEVKNRRGAEEEGCTEGAGEEGVGVFCRGTMGMERGSI
jgi:hypothetical protein